MSGLFGFNIVVISR